MAARDHRFDALAWEENFALKRLRDAIPGCRATTREISWLADGGGEVFAYPFGAVVFHDVPPERRQAEIDKVMRAYPALKNAVATEDYRVREESSVKTGVSEAMLHIDRLTPERAGMVALTVAQSSAMEFYERLIEALFQRVQVLVDRLEKRGNVSLRTKPLHRFFGEAISTRNEVIAVLYLLDKPDVTWDDHVMDMIYDDLRDEFDLGDRYESVESKLRSIQETLELILDIARERRMMFLEVSVALLFVLEVAFEIWNR
jgi:uncharacterized Rmd1/YagE family protein